MTRRRPARPPAAAALVAALAGEARAIPPLVAGDVPTADKYHLEWFLGTRYQETGGVERQVPFTELVVGISGRQEVTFEIPYLSAEGVDGFGDAVLGTKYQFLIETDRLPGVAGSLEVKLDNASRADGLGTGALERELRLRSQKTRGWYTGLANLGYTFVDEPEADGVRQERRNVLFAAFAQEYEVLPATRLLSEIYWKNSDEPGQPARLAADVGFKQRLAPWLSVHAALGKSLRKGNAGGPRLRVYAGVKLEFPLVPPGPGGVR